MQHFLEPSLRSRSLSQTSLFPKIIKDLIAKWQPLSKHEILSHFWHTLFSKQTGQIFPYRELLSISDSLPCFAFGSEGQGVSTGTKPWVSMLPQPLWASPKISCHTDRELILWDLLVRGPQSQGSHRAGTSIFCFFYTTLADAALTVKEKNKWEWPKSRALLSYGKRL